MRLRDDKSYPFIKVTVQEEWPRVYFARGIIRDGSRYFGPYTDSRSVRQTLDTLNRLFPFRTCHRTITGKDPRACLLYHIHRCTAPCIGVADHGEYMQAIGQVVLFLEGKQERIIDELRRQMEQAAEDLKFEHAARLRDRVRALEKIVERQKIIVGRGRRPTGTSSGWRSATATPARSCSSSGAGSWLGASTSCWRAPRTSPPGRCSPPSCSSSTTAAAQVPPEILVPEEVEEQETLAQWLGEQRRGEGPAGGAEARGEAPAGEDGRGERLPAAGDAEAALAER